MVWLGPVFNLNWSNGSEGQGYVVLTVVLCSTCQGTNAVVVCIWLDEQPHSMLQSTPDATGCAASISAAVLTLLGVSHLPSCFPGHQKNGATQALCGASP